MTDVAARAPSGSAGSLVLGRPVSTCPANWRRNDLSCSETTDTLYQPLLRWGSTAWNALAPGRTT